MANIFNKDSSWRDDAKEMYEQMRMVSGTVTTPPPTSDNILRDAIKMRMRNNMPFEFWQATFNSSKNEVVVFIIHKGTPMFIEDGYDLFPSDALVTKLRLLLG